MLAYRYRIAVSLRLGQSLVAPPEGPSAWPSAMVFQFSGADREGGAGKPAMTLVGFGYAYKQSDFIYICV